MQNLTLTQINESQYYARHCALARESAQTKKARLWLDIAYEAACRDLQTCGQKYDAIELLQVAAELCAYYDRHVAEIDAVEHASYVAKARQYHGERIEFRQRANSAW